MDQPGLVALVQKQLTNQLKTAKAIDSAVILILILMIVIIIIWLYNTLKLSNKNCKNLETIYSSSKNAEPTLNNINTTNSDFEHKFYDYYIKTAYNCCCAGNFKNDFVDSPNTSPPYCALTNCIQQGARCLDYEIYSYNQKPIIAASSVNSVNIKETFNYLDFDEAMVQTANLAFNPTGCNNWYDPLILNLRIMSNDYAIYPLIAASILNNFKGHLLDDTYNIANYCKNLGALPLLFFQNKIIVIVDSNTYNNLLKICPVSHTQDCGNTQIQNMVSMPNISKCQIPNLLEVINMHSGSSYINTLRYSDLTTKTDHKTLQSQNKRSLTILLPDYNNNAKNTNPSLAMNYGCQMIGMSFQIFDTFMEWYSLYFNKVGSAFALKPERLRYIQQYIEVPPPLPAKYQFGVKEKNFTLSGDEFQLASIKYPGPNAPWTYKSNN